MNKMIIYCKNPDRAVKRFTRAVGLHNPDTESTPSYSPADLHAFRLVVCEELEVATSNYDDNEKLWIAKLPGTD